MKRPLIVFGLVLALLAACSTPWIVNGGAALNFNAYDLAEWTTLHPAAGQQSPPLLTALLLRLPLLCTGLWAAWMLAATLHRRTSRLIIVGGLVIVLAIALLPPPEILADGGNGNYQQQAGLAALMLMIGMAALIGWPPPVRWGIAALSLVIGAAAGVTGLGQAAAWMQEYRLPGITGTGLLAFAGLCVLALVVTGLFWWEDRRIAK